MHFVLRRDESSHARLHLNHICLIHGTAPDREAGDEHMKRTKTVDPHRETHNRTMTSYPPTLRH